jgi:hypothetical protein
MGTSNWSRSSALAKAPATIDLHDCQRHFGDNAQLIL